MTWGTRGGTMIHVIIEISPCEIAGHPVQALETPHGQMSARVWVPGTVKSPKHSQHLEEFGLNVCLALSSHVCLAQASSGWWVLDVSAPLFCKQQRKSWISWLNLLSLITPDGAQKLQGWSNIKDDVDIMSIFSVMMIIAVELLKIYPSWSQLYWLDWCVRVGSGPVCGAGGGLSWLAFLTHNHPSLPQPSVSLQVSDMGHYHTGAGRGNCTDKLKRCDTLTGVRHHETWNQMLV